jgi:hypothetical protein
MFVPVVDQNQNPLMPTTLSRARRWIKSGKATFFWKRGVLGVCYWNVSFSLLEVGKQWFYFQLEKRGIVETQLRTETKKLRNKLGLKNFNNKLTKIYSAHCLDSGVLANSSNVGISSPTTPRC